MSTATPNARRDSDGLALSEDPVEDWIRRAEEVPKIMRQRCAEKAAKNYGSKAQYRVSPPRNERRGGNKSPRVVYVYAGTDFREDDLRLRIYNSAGGHTWANKPDGTPVDVGSLEDLYEYLASRLTLKLRRKSKR